MSPRPRNYSVVDPDPGLFEHPDPDPKRAKHRPKLYDILPKFSEMRHFVLLKKCNLAILYYYIIRS